MRVLFLDGDSSVGLEFPKVEVRFEHLKVDSFIHVGSRALPTIPNFIFNMTEVGDRFFQAIIFPNIFLYS